MNVLGTVVPLMCTSDVVDASGNVVIPMGSVAYGKVLLSQGGSKQGEDGGRGRLQVSIDAVTAADGTQLKVSAVPKGLQTSPLDIDTDRTAVIRSSGALQRAWAQQPVRKDFVKLAQFIASSKRSDLSDNPDSAALIRKLAEEVPLPATVRLKDSEMLRVASLVGQIGTGGVDFGSLAKADRAQLEAVVEFTGAVGFIEDRLAAPKPNAVRARVGLPFTAYVIEDAKVRVN